MLLSSGKSLSSTILKDQFTSPCPWGPIYNSLSLSSILKSLSLSSDHKPLSLSSSLKALSFNSDHKSLPCPCPQSRTWLDFVVKPNCSDCVVWQQYLATLVGRWPVVTTTRASLSSHWCLLTICGCVHLLSVVLLLFFDLLSMVALLFLIVYSEFARSTWVSRLLLTFRQCGAVLFNWIIE